jgi:CheY-like chemotaxis protein
MLKFLLIEDDESIRTILKTLLKRNFTCAVIEAENGKMGLQALHDNLPDLIFLDISMPVMDGAETLSIIRSNAIFKNIPVMIITAMNDKKLVGELATLGISDYMLKPIDIPTTVKRIQKFIQLSETRKKEPNKIASQNNSENKIEQLLIVDNDKKFKDFANSLLNNKYIIHEASSGTAGLEVFSRFYPKYIFVSDELGLLDKKILTHKIRELAAEENVYIYILVDDIKKISTKVFNYDGVITKSLDKEKFLKDVESLTSSISKVEPEQIIIKEEL